MDQIDIAIHQTAHDAAGGLNELARKMGIGAQVLRNKVCPTTETSKLNVREALAVMLITGDLRILEAVAAELNCTVQRKTLPDARSIVSAVLDADAEHGDVARQIHDALADGKLTELEKAEIIKQIHEAQEALAVLASTVQHAPTMIGRVS